MAISRPYIKIIWNCHQHSDYYFKVTISVPLPKKKTTLNSSAVCRFDEINLYREFKGKTPSNRHRALGGFLTG